MVTLFKGCLIETRLYILVHIFVLFIYCFISVNPRRETKGLISWCFHVIHQAGPLNPPHVPAPCPHLSPKPIPCPSPKSSLKGLYITFSNVIHHSGPLNPPHVPTPCPPVLP